MISDAAMRSAKVAAINRDLSLREWVERAVTLQAGTDAKAIPLAEHAAAQKREGK